MSIGFNKYFVYPLKGAIPVKGVVSF